MDRRLLISALACWPFGRLLAQDEAPRPRHKISAAELYNAMAARFPLRFGLGGLLELQVSAPRLLLLPARNRIGAALLAEFGGSQGRQVQGGEVDLAFSLRYQASDQTMRAHQPEILDLRWPGLPPETLQVLQGVLPAMARQLGPFVLHKFTPRELALADTMGFEPQEIKVVEDGVVLLFGPKLPR